MNLVRSAEKSWCIFESAWLSHRRQSFGRCAVKSVEQTWGFWMILVFIVRVLGETLKLSGPILMMVSVRISSVFCSAGQKQCLRSPYPEVSAWYVDMLFIALQQHENQLHFWSARLSKIMTITPLNVSHSQLLGEMEELQELRPVFAVPLLNSISSVRQGRRWRRIYAGLVLSWADCAGC